MATGTKPGAFSYFAESQEEQERLRELQESRKALQDALLNRQQLFDPTLLAMAQGFLMPTKSGGFGESLANVAGMVGPAQAAEQKREIEMAQIRRELAMQDFMAAQQAETYRQMAQQPSITDVMSGRAGPVAAGRAAAPSVGAPAGAAPGPVAAEGPVGAGPSPSGAMKALSMIEKELNSPRPEIAARAEKRLKIWENATKDRYKVENRVVYDLFDVDASGAPRIVADLGEQKPYEITFKGEGRAVPATAVEVEEYKKAQARGPQAEEEAFNRLFKGRRTGAEAMPYGGERKSFVIGYIDESGNIKRLYGEGDPKDIATLRQLETEARKTGDYSKLLQEYGFVTKQPVPKTTGAPKKAGAKEEVGVAEEGPASTRAKELEEAEFAKEVGTSKAKTTRDRIALGDDALSRRQSSEAIINLAKQPGMESVQGIFEKPGVVYGVLKAAEEGLSLGRGFSIGVPQIREILAVNNVKLPKIEGETPQQYQEREMKVITNMQLLSSQFAQQIFGFRSLAKGQGAISNLENNIFGRMAPTEKDTLQSLISKATHAKARAEFDEKVADILIKEGISWDKLRSQQRYREMVSNYDNQLKSIYSGTYIGLEIGKPRKSSGSPSGGASEADRRLREELQLP